MGKSNVIEAGMNVAIISCGEKSTNSSGIKWITPKNEEQDCFSFDSTDKLLFKINVSQSAWMNISLTKL